MVGAPQIPSTMKAAMVVKHGAPLEMKEVPVPKPGDGEVLIQIECSGVCHTDLHVKDGDWPVKSPLPMTLGHEGVGKVVALGPGVNRLKIGDRVCTPWMHKCCGHCEYCVSGWETTCPEMTAAGFVEHGSFAEYMKAPEPYVNLVPAGLSNEQAAPLACAGVTAYKALKVSRVQPGQWIAIVGAAGGLGHLAVQYARAMGMRVAGVGRGSDKMSYLTNLGCEVVVDNKEANYVSKLSELTGGVHGALILAPSTQATSEAVNYIRKRGVIVQVAAPAGEFTVNIPAMIVKIPTITASASGTRQDLNEALDFAARGKAKCDVAVRKFSEVNAALDDLKSGRVKGRLVLIMS